MRNFSDILILEARQVDDKISKTDFELYVEKTKNRIPKEVVLVLSFLYDNNIFDKSIIDTLVSGTKSQAVGIAKSLNIDIADITDLQKMLKSLGTNIRLIPMYQSEDERDAFIKGDKNSDDITLDLETERGRDAVAKEYFKLVKAIAVKYRNAGLDWNGLISAGLLGLTNAMKDYRRDDFYANLENGVARDEAKRQKRLSFKQYAGWRIRQQILNDIQAFSRTVRITQYAYNNNKANDNTTGNFNTVGLFSYDDEKGTMADSMIELSTTPDTNLDDNKKILNALEIMLKRRFTNRDIIMFYKSFGLNGYEEMKQKDIAKEFNVTPANVTYMIKKILSYIQEDPKSKKILQMLYNHHFESLCLKNYNKSREDIMDAFISDDLHILLENMVKYDDKNTFNNKVGSVLEHYTNETREFIMMCLEKDFTFIDENYSNNKHIIVDFLENIFPTEKLKTACDLDILNKMANISDIFKEHNF